MDSFFKETVRFRGRRVGVTVVGSWMIKGGRKGVVDLNSVEFWIEKNNGGCWCWSDFIISSIVFCSWVLNTSLFDGNCWGCWGFAVSFLVEEVDDVTFSSFAKLGLAIVLMACDNTVLGGGIGTCPFFTILKLGRNGFIGKYGLSVMEIVFVAVVVVLVEIDVVMVLVVVGVSGKYR